MVIKLGPKGRFLGCSGWPECRFTKELNGASRLDDQLENGRTIDRKCPLCGSPLIVRSGRFGRFLACSRYPKCHHTEPYPLGMPCPIEGCQGEVVERAGKRGRVFYGCSRYPECSFRSWQRPVAKTCPVCGNPYLVVGKSKGKPVLRCPNKGCNYREPFPEQER